MTPYFDRDGITLVVGNCLDVLPQLELSGVALVLADPPYGISQEGKTITRHSGSRLNLDFFAEDRDAETMTEIVVAACRLTLATLAARGVAYWFCGHQQFGQLELALRESGRPTGFLVWERTNPAPSVRKASWRSAAELCVWAGRPKHFLGQREMLNVQHFGALANGQREKCCHPTQKPLALIKRIIEATTDPGDLILDPFAGSGTTLRACADLGRRCIGVELRPEYADMAVSRMQQMAMPLDVTLPQAQERTA